MPSQTDPRTRPLVLACSRCGQTIVVHVEADASCLRCAVRMEAVGAQRDGKATPA
jgi:hypothetical protein